MASGKSRNAQVREVRATFDTREADKWCEQLEKRFGGRAKDHEVTRRRETFSFGVVYVVMAVKRAARKAVKARKAITKNKKPRAVKPKAPEAAAA